MRQKVCENPDFHAVVPATCKNNKITKKIKIKNPKCPPPVDPPSPPPAVVIAGTGSVRGGRHCHRPPSLLDSPAPPPHCSHRWSRIRMRRQPLLLPEPTVPRTGSMRGSTAAAAPVVVGSVAPTTHCRCRWHIRAKKGPGARSARGQARQIHSGRRRSRPLPHRRRWRCPPPASPPRRCRSPSSPAVTHAPPLQLSVRGKERRKGEIRGEERRGK